MWNFCEFIHNRFFNVSLINRCNKSRESMFSTNSFRFVWPTFNCFTMSVLATVNDFKIENKNNCLWYWESTNNFPPENKKEERKTQSTKRVVSAPKSKEQQTTSSFTTYTIHLCWNTCLSHTGPTDIECTSDAMQWHNICPSRFPPF